MGTTPKYKLPWPEMNEPSDGPGAYRKLAEATETALNGHDTSIKAIHGVQFIATPHANSTLLSSYPLGVSLMYMTSAEVGAGWPQVVASLVVTFRDSPNLAATQYFYRLDTTNAESWVRTMVSTANSPWHQVTGASYRTQTGTDTVSIGKNNWSGIGIKTFESNQGSDIAASGNGMIVKRAGKYRVDLNILMIGGNAAQVTLTVGVGTSTAPPSGFNRVSAFCGTSSCMLNGTWLLTLSANTTIMAWVTHNNSANASFSTRRLSIQRVDN